MHARNKPLDRCGNEEHEEDALLHKVADLTIGYSGAELANLLNESAILAVRFSSTVLLCTLNLRSVCSGAQLAQLLNRVRHPCHETRI